MTSHSGVRAKQLPAHPVHGVELHCTSCGAVYAASRSDYFTLNDNDLVGPCECGGALALTAPPPTPTRTRNG